MGRIYHCHIHVYVPHVLLVEIRFNLHDYLVLGVVLRNAKKISDRNCSNVFDQSDPSGLDVCLENYVLL